MIYRGNSRTAAYGRIPMTVCMINHYLLSHLYTMNYRLVSHTILTTATFNTCDT